MRYRSSLLLVGLLALCPASTMAKDEPAKSETPAMDEDTEFRYNFLVGTYALIGQKPEGGATYSGTVEMSRNEAGTLRIVRTIGGKPVEGLGTLETALEDTKVLRVRFTEEDVEYETTYLIQGDLDNFARISGYLYARKSSPNRPGLEALFVLP